MAAVQKRKIRWAISLLPMMLYFSCLTAQAQYGGGSGEPNDPYLIYTAAQMNAIGANENDWAKHFKLMADIDLSSYKGTDFNIIGYYRTWQDRKYFNGVFDGNGHTISNFSYTSTDANNIGIFGYVEDPNAEIKDLGLINPNVEAGTRKEVGSLVGCLRYGTITGCYVNGGSVSGDNSVGGLVGALNLGGTITNSYATGSVSGERTVGGLVGMNRGTITNCYSTSSVTGYGTEWFQGGVGGLVGRNYSGTITNCYATGSVLGVDEVGGLIGQSHRGTTTMCYSEATVTGNGYNVGGLVGWNEGGIIEQCFAVGQIEGQSAVGGLVGFNYEDGYYVGWNKRSYIEFCYAQGVVTGSDKVGGLVGYNRRGTVYGCYSTGRATGGKDVGGLIGFHDRGPVRLSYWDIETSGLSSSAAGRGSTTEKLMMADTFVGWGDGVWRIDQGHDYPRLAWEQTPGELIVETGPRYGGGEGTLDDPYQVLTADQLIGLAYHPEDYDKHFALMADLDLSAIDPNKIVPIGMEFAPFTGTFEGNGHIVSNFVYESEDENYVGLFGRVGPMFSKPTEHEGVIQNLHLVNTRIHGKDQVGGIAGECSGTINACSVTGNIQGKEMIGGLVGYNRGSINTSYSTGDVSGNESVGGLVGWNSGSINTSYSTGDVSGNEDVGGLVGYNVSRVTTSYSTGAVNGNYSVGGLVGLNEPRGTIVRCYSTGPVTGSPNIGGLVGAGQTRCTFLSFWDVETSGVLSSAGGSGKTTAQMFVAETFEGWGLSSDWTIDERSDYPHLAWENTPGTLIVSQPYTYGGGSGQPEDPYQIWTPEQFVSITDRYEDFNKCFALMADIDMNSVSLDRIRPIGTEVIPFSGIFEGNYHIIHNLHYDANYEDGVGVFGYLGNLRLDDSFSEGTVKNLHLANVAVAGRNCVGGLAGRCYGGTLVSCGVSGRVTGGGSVGGLVGLGWGANISSSSTSGTVDGWVEVGGLVGQQQGQVIQCSSACQVSGHEKLGGLIGSNRPYPEESLLSQCTAAGSVRGHRVLGGLVGVNGGIITNCYAAVDVIGEPYTSPGGISGPRTMYSYRVAGLVGANNGQIMFSYSSSNVEGHQEVGGLIGAQEKGESVSCFWDVEASGTTDGVGTLDPDPEDVMGNTTAEMQTASTFLGANWDFVDETANGTEDIWSICEGTNYPRLVWQIPAGDFVCPDGITIEDFVFFIEHWRDDNCDLSNDYCQGTDLDFSGTVDEADLEILVENWLAVGKD